MAERSSAPVPTTVSPEMQALIGAPFRPSWNMRPATGKPGSPGRLAGVAGDRAPSRLMRAPARPVREDDGRRRARLRRHARGARAPEPRPAPDPHSRRLLRSFARRGGSAGGHPDGRLRRLSGAVRRLSDAARGVLSGRARRLRRGVEVDRRNQRSGQDGGVRNFGRRRAHAGARPAGETGRPAAAGRDRVRDADVGRHENRRHVLYKRTARQRARVTRRVLRCGDAILRQRPRPCRPASVSRLWRMPAFRQRS